MGRPKDERAATRAQAAHDKRQRRKIHREARRNRRQAAQATTTEQAPDTTGAHRESTA